MNIPMAGPAVSECSTCQHEGKICKCPICQMHLCPCIYYCNNCERPICKSCKFVFVRNCIYGKFYVIYCTECLTNLKCHVCDTHMSNYGPYICKFCHHVCCKKCKIKIQRKDIFCKPCWTTYQTCYFCKKRVQEMKCAQCQKCKRFYCRKHQQKKDDWEYVSLCYQCQKDEESLCILQ